MFNLRGFIFFPFGQHLLYFAMVIDDEAPLLLGGGEGKGAPELGVDEVASVVLNLADAFFVIVVFFLTERGD